MSNKRREIEFLYGSGMEPEDIWSRMLHRYEGLDLEYVLEVCDMYEDGSFLNEEY